MTPRRRLSRGQKMLLTAGAVLLGAAGGFFVSIGLPWATTRRTLSLVCSLVTVCVAAPLLIVGGVSAQRSSEGRAKA